MFKLFSINSIRSRMVSGFLFLTILILILAVVSLLVIDSITGIARMHSTISQLETQTLSLMKIDNDFLDLETINENFFKTHKSDFLNRRDSLNDLITSGIRRLIKEERTSRYGIEKSILNIDSSLLLYNSGFRQLEDLIFKKGFKDYGVEGAMRFQAHALEELISDQNMLDLLFLRRHEKDFLLRNDTSYLTAFRSRAKQLLAAMKKKPDANAISATYHLREYQSLFFQLAQIQTELGLTSKHGLRNELNALTYSLARQYYSLSGDSYTYSEIAFGRVRIFYIALLIGAIGFSVLSGYWISKRLSEPIAKLSKTIEEKIRSRNISQPNLTMNDAANEITTLAKSFNMLMEHSNIQMEHVRRNSNLLTEQNKELEKINRELDNFLYSTAHDLRSPLSSLLGLLNLLKHENKQDSLTPYFDFMEKSIHRSETFISQIVGFSKNKRLDIVPERLDLQQIISDILESHQFIEGAASMKKSVTINGEVPFFSDQNRIIMIFTNLISNAIKYADHGKQDPFIRITITIDEENAHIEFVDNGLGIGREHIEHIFDMFYRAHNKSKGSGLGLFIFKETVQRLEGHASVESDPGVGTKFLIRLPNRSSVAKVQFSIRDTSAN